MFDYDDTLTHENCDCGMVPLVIIPTSSKERSSILNNKELYEEINARTEKMVRAQSQQAQPKKSPKD
jgi:hypothetical protein